MKFIFPGRSDGIEILKYLSISIPFIIITQTTTSILQSIGVYILPVVNLFIGCIVKIILTMVLVPIENMNIYGAVIASIGAYIVSSFLNILVMKVKLKTKMQMYNNFIKPAYAASFMIIGVLVVYNFIYTKIYNNGISCLLSISIGAIIYAVGIVVLRVFSIDELKNRLRKRI